MDMDQAAVWLAGSILTMLGFIVVIGGMVVINNILHRYWKPVRIFTADSWSGINPPARFAHEQEIEKIAPKLDKEDKTK
jgi:hypothetical protein